MSYEHRVNSINSKLIALHPIFPSTCEQIANLKGSIDELPIDVLQSEMFSASAENLKSLAELQMEIINLIDILGLTKELSLN